MKLIFLHIPKAAGTTFHGILHRLYNKREIFDIRVVKHKSTIQQFIDLPQGQKDKIMLLKGHMMFGLDKYFSSDDVQYVTFLRNPVNRIVSLYSYILEQPQHYLYAKVVGGKMSLMDFVKSNLTHELDNDQTRLLSGVDSFPVADSFELAINNLQDKFISFGITERFDESLILFKHVLNWSSNPYYIKQNVSKQSEPLSEEIRKIIEERNNLDVKLYSWALAEFEKNINSLDNIDEEVKLFKSLNPSYAHGYNFGYENGYNSGYNYVYNKFPLLLLAKKIKSTIFKKQK